MSTAVDFRDVDIVFGEDQRVALDMIDRGATREEILAATGSVLGCAGANLTVETGEICVLMGLSGSGKSTLLRAVNRLNVPARGKVLVKDGEHMVDVVNCDEKTLRHIRQTQVAMVFQQFALLPWRTVEQVELATLEYVWWWNHQRLHGELEMRTPVEVEEAYYAGQESAQPAPAGQANR